jgi:sigma-B regulation protein RsbU (phosphoserine phosphatase)
MAVNRDTLIRDELIARRNRLKTLLAQNKDAQLAQLFREIDLALERIDRNTYGICEICHDSIENDRLVANPLVRVCLDHLNASEQHALEQDIDLAGRMQQALLPKNNFLSHNWQIYYYYQAAGPVSGDYCDLVELKDEQKSLLAIVGDVSGKGIAASMLMMHLHAMFHSMLEFNLPVNKLVDRANHLLCQSTLSSHYSTLICSRLSADGNIDLCNAGHCPPFLMQNGKVHKIEATGLPIGLLCEGQYTTRNLRLQPGESILFYSDGLSEAHKNGEEYGIERIGEVLNQFQNLSAAQLVGIVLEDLASFLDGDNRNDDLTIMVVKRV